jgi:hypothetical protein
MIPDMYWFSDISLVLVFNISPTLVPDASLLVWLSAIRWSYVLGLHQFAMPACWFSIISDTLELCTGCTSSQCQLAGSLLSAIGWCHVLALYQFPMPACWSLRAILNGSDTAIRGPDTGQSRSVILAS